MDSETSTEALDDIRNYYDTVYYREPRTSSRVSRHLFRLSNKICVQEHQTVLDIACGQAEWLCVCSQRGAVPYGIDLSFRAIARGKQVLPRGGVCAGSAGFLPIKSGIFDIVSCLGALEHFPDQRKAIAEMIRVAKVDAAFLLLVPNADFLTRRLGFFGGTDQSKIKEDVKTLEEWERLFVQAGLEVKEKWRDLHVFSWSWISLGRWYSIPLRFIQALALTIWPLKWQYQVYFLCNRKSV